MTKETSIDLGFYIVGRHDGTVEPFFVHLVIDECGDKIALHHVEAKLCDSAVKNVDDWWWHLMDTDGVPENFDHYPDSIKEPPYDS